MERTYYGKISYTLFESTTLSRISTRWESRFRTLALDGLRRFRFRLKQVWPLWHPLCRSSCTQRFSDTVNFIHSLPCKVTAYQGPVQTYVDTFENGDVRQLTRKRWSEGNTIASVTELESCKKYMMFDITSVFVRPYVNEKLAFSKLSTLTSVFEKNALSVTVFIWYVWTGPFCICMVALSKHDSKRQWNWMKAAQVTFVFGSEHITWEIMEYLHGRVVLCSKRDKLRFVS